MAPPPPRRSFLGLFFVEETTETRASPQFPPPTYPTTYYGTARDPNQVLAAPQGPAPLATIAIQAVKKPCVLTAWFQKLKGCGSR